MANLSVRLVLTGARTGHTTFLGGYQFNQGVYIANGDEVTVPKLSRYLGRAYKAFPEGSQELLQAQEEDAANPLIRIKDGMATVPSRAQIRRMRKDEDAMRLRIVKEKSNGSGKAQVAQGSGTEPGSSTVSGVLPSGGGSAPVSPDDGSGADGNPSRETGSVSCGDGRENPGDDGPTTDAHRILQALSELDPAEDEHWTSEKLPRLDAVAHKAGLPSVTRAQVKAVAPEFRRGAV